jgi:hypothetical protein
MRGFEWGISLSDMSEDVREAIYFVPEAIYAYYKCPRCGSVDYFWIYTGAPDSFISPIIFNVLGLLVGLGVGFLLPRSVSIIKLYCCLHYSYLRGGN